MGYERAEILILMRAFPEACFSVNVPSHHRHVLEMAFTSFVADGAVVGMVEHEPLDAAPPELHYLWIVDGDAHSIFYLGHAGHNDIALRIFIIVEKLQCALPACTYGPEGRMPAEVGNVEAEIEACLQQVPTFSDIVWLIFYVYRCH
jgi:hypothetical protein